MKKEKHKLKQKRKKTRKRWAINPRTRVHGESKYKRGKKKKEERKIIKEETEETNKK